MQKRNRKFANLKIHQTTRDKLKEISDLSGKSMAQLLSDYINSLYQIAGSFKKGINIDYDFRVTSGILYIQIFGRSRLITGSFQMPIEATEKEVDAEISKRICSQIQEKEGEN